MKTCIRNLFLVLTCTRLFFLVNPLNAQQQVSDACWSGTWQGTYSSQTASCGFTDSGNITLTLSVVNGVVSGTGSENGTKCYNTTTCELLGYGSLSGPVAGTVLGMKISLTGNWVNSCNDVSYPVVFDGTLSGCTITGSPSLTLQRQGGCETCMVTPTITWNSPAAITYGTPLSSSQLDATASVAGTFAYTPASGTVLNPGTTTLSVTFTPTDTVDYTTATATVSLVVLPATATVTGQVTCSCDNSPVAGVTVTIGSLSAQTDGSGNYSISGLSPGTYPVTISGPGYNYSGLPQITITSSEILTTSDFTLKPNATDIAELNAIAPASSVTIYTRNNGTGIEADFEPVNVTISVAACRLGFDHFNWIQEATGAGYNNQFCNCPLHPGAWFTDPPQYQCDGSINELLDPQTQQQEWPADLLPFYWNEGTSSSDPYNVINHTYTSALTFVDSPNVDPSGTGLGASFVTSLVGVRADGTYQYLRTFAWSSSYSLFGISGGVNILSASLLNITNGTGGVTNIQNDLSPLDIPPGALLQMTQGGAGFPIIIQPASQTVVSGANVTFAIFPTNSSSPLNYQWRMNGTNISSATNLTLQLMSVTTNNSGNYDAVLSNSNGSIASAVSTLTVVNVPIFQPPVRITNGQVLLTWDAPLGTICQLQYITNLSQTTWINIGSAITASNLVMSATNVFSSDQQRFYRVQQQ
jgi:hypothetical protein